MIQIDNTVIAASVFAWYALGVSSVALYELAKNRFKYFQKQDVVRSLFYGVAGPVATVYTFFKLAVGRDLSYIRGQLVNEYGFKARLWESKEERMRGILRNGEKGADCAEMEARSYQQMPTPVKAVKARP